MKTLCHYGQRAIAAANALPVSAASLVARLAMATVFWRAAQTKLSGWELWGQQWNPFAITDTTVLLFEYEYALPLLSPVWAAHLAACTEFGAAIALALGLATRLSALALLGMTTVIQLLVYPEAWPVHSLWAACLLYLLKDGPGRLSLDAVVAARLAR